MNKDYFKELLEIIDLVPGKGLFKMGKKQISRILKIYKERVIAVIEIIKSHENPFVQKLYEEYLGKPMGEISHHLLHTHYFDRTNEVIIDE